MANIVGSTSKMTDTEIASDQPLSQALFLKIGANINALLDRGARKAEFTVSGTWACPADVTQVTLYGAGGGGGGATGGFTDGSTGTVAGSGGAGSLPILISVTVTPGTSYSVTIGGGGAGGVWPQFGPDQPGSAGGQTKFGTVATFNGAAGGFINAQSGSNGGWSPQLQATSGGIANANGQNSITASGGAAGYRDGNTGRGGGGGGAGIGAGGVGGAASRNVNSGNGGAGGVSAGGGAGGGVYSNNNSGTPGSGGAGGSGYLLIMY